MASPTTINEQEKTFRRLSKRSKIFKTIIQALQEKKGENIVSVDLRKLPEAVADYFVLCEADTAPQVRAIADHVEESVLKTLKEKPYEKEGFSSLQWVILDYINIVVHVFRPEERQFYNLEEMWNDAVQEQH